MKSIKNIRQYFHSLTIAIFTLCFLLSGCDLGEPPKKIEWFLGFDVTTSISEADFQAYKSLAMKTVLARLKNDDKVHILRIDSNPEDDVKTFVIDGGRTQMIKQAIELNEYIHDGISQPENYRGSTNIGGFLTYLKRNIENVNQQRQLLKSTGKPLPPEPVRVGIIFTDGLPEGVQTRQEGEWHSNLKIFFWGVAPRYENRVEDLCNEMSIPQENFQTIRFSDTEMHLPLFGLEWGRPLDAGLLKSLETKKMQIHAL